LATDHDHTVMEASSEPVARYFLKRPHFGGESEIRVVAPLPRLFEAVDVDSAPSVGGMNVVVDLPALVAGVKTPPDAPKWLVEAVADALRRHDITAPVTSSALSAPATYYCSGV
jgi:hypothetical protein